MCKLQTSPEAIDFIEDVENSDESDWDILSHRWDIVRQWDSVTMSQYWDIVRQCKPSKLSGVSVAMLIIRFLKKRIR